MLCDWITGDNTEVNRIISGKKLTGFDTCMQLLIKSIQIIPPKQLLLQFIVHVK